MEGGRSVGLFSSGRGRDVQLSQERIVRSIFGRANFAFKWQRRYVHLGAILRRGQGSALSRDGRVAQDWMSSQFVGEWPFPMTCEGRMRNYAAPAHYKCTRRVVTIARGITLLAPRLLDANNPELARPLRACRGADSSRAPHSVRQSAETSACRLARGSPTCEAS